jgi:hypothetical protein
MSMILHLSSVEKLYHRDRVFRDKIPPLSSTNGAYLQE